jgi:hypothetical protein
MAHWDSKPIGALTLGLVLSDPPCAMNATDSHPFFVLTIDGTQTSTSAALYRCGPTPSPVSKV